jgi:hypothetical protein
MQVLHAPCIPWHAHCCDARFLLLAQVPGQGRGVVAAQHIPYGTELLRERPLVCIPGFARQKEVSRRQAVLPQLHAHVHTHVTDIATASTEGWCVLCACWCRCVITAVRSCQVSQSRTPTRGSPSAARHAARCESTDVHACRQRHGVPEYLAGSGTGTTPDIS